MSEQITLDDALERVERIEDAERRLLGKCCANCLWSHRRGTMGDLNAWNCSLTTSLMKKRDSDEWCKGYEARDGDD